MSEKANLHLGEEVLELSVVTGSEGERAIDITKLRAQTGMVTLDNGYMNTGAVTSAVTFLDGEKGILRYRGYPIEQLAEKACFVEVSYLLYFNKRPSAEELSNFEAQIKEFSTLPKGIEFLIDTFPNSAHPMAVLSSAMVALSAYYPEMSKEELNDDEKARVIAQLMGQTKVIMARFFRNTISKEHIASDPSLSYSADFLNMMFGGTEGYKESKDIANALDSLLILHADHEQNCSASTVRMVGSSNANIFASISAGIDALWGPLHGGANQAVLEMLQEIQNAGGDYELFIKKAKDKSDPFKLMGFGHRVYKNFDPRATIIKGACDKVLDILGVQDPLLDIASGLETVARQDEYFVQRNLYPNVDFYSGVIYKALGIPTKFFTPMFVLGRLPGWLAQWREQRETPGAKICRPRQIYTGENQRDF